MHLQSLRSWPTLSRRLRPYVWHYVYTKSYGRYRLTRGPKVVCGDKCNMWVVIAKDSRWHGPWKYWGWIQQ